MSKKIITLTGPSCSGKSTLASQLVETGLCTEIISTTTRLMREGEVNGDAYHFVSPEEFETIEMLERVEFNGNTYGGSVAEFEARFATGKIPVIVVEPYGLTQINENAQEKNWCVVNVFVNCPPLLQAERFLSRMLDDYLGILDNGSSDAYSKLMTEYTNRMATMQSVENEWADICRNTISKYGTDNLFVSSFEKENEKDAVKSIFELVT